MGGMGGEASSRMSTMVVKNVSKDPKNNGKEAPKKYDRLGQNRVNPAGTEIFGILPGMPGQISGCPTAAPSLPSNMPKIR
jgi:hypothetical protein